MFRTRIIEPLHTHTPPTARVPASYGDRPSEHEQVCHQLGVIQTLSAFCRDNGIPSYDLDEVRKYLHKVMGEGKWAFYPVRPKDRRNATHSFFGGPETVWCFDRVYDKPIPLPVLYRMKLLAEKFPLAKFFVSDERRAGDVVRDPFLAVETDDGVSVVDQWDEPGFNRKEREG